MLFAASISSRSVLVALGVVVLLAGVCLPTLGVAAPLLAALGAVLSRFAASTGFRSGTVLAAAATAAPLSGLLGPLLVLGSALSLLLSTRLALLPGTLLCGSCLSLFLWSVLCASRRSLVALTTALAVLFASSIVSVLVVHELSRARGPVDGAVPPVADGPETRLPILARAAKTTATVHR